MEQQCGDPSSGYVTVQCRERDPQSRKVTNNLEQK